MAGEVGGRRRDAGTVHVSARDVAALRFVGETGGARLSLLRRLLAVHGEAGPGPISLYSVQTIRPPGQGGRSDSATRAWVARMVRGGYARQTQVLRATWVTLTPAGARLADLVDDHGRAAPRVIESALLADHTNTVGLLRLHLQELHPEAEWIPERHYWIKQGEEKTSFHRPDGALDFGGGRLVGIEVELTGKRPERYPAILGGTHRDLKEVWWFAPPELTGWLRRTLDAAQRAVLEGPSLFGAPTVTPFTVYGLPEDCRP